MTALRPIPKLDDAAAMAKLGRLHALRNARLDAARCLRDAVTRLQGESFNTIAEDIAEARQALDRMEEVIALESATYPPSA